MNKPAAIVACIFDSLLFIGMLGSIYTVLMIALMLLLMLGYAGSFGSANGGEISSETDAALTQISGTVAIVCGLLVIFLLFFAIASLISAIRCGKYIALDGAIDKKQCNGFVRSTVMNFIIAIISVCVCIWAAVLLAQEEGGGIATIFLLPADAVIACIAGVAKIAIVKKYKQRIGNNYPPNNYSPYGGGQYPPNNYPPYNGGGYPLNQYPPYPPNRFPPDNRGY